MLNAGQLKMDAVNAAYAALKAEARIANATVPENISRRIDYASTTWTEIKTDAVRLQFSNASKQDDDKMILQGMQFLQILPIVCI